jgi:hypothetical protein
VRFTGAPVRTQMDMQNTSNFQDHEQAIARLIARRYGDGGVYVPRQQPRRGALKDAIAGGFVSEDGFITSKGRRLLARFDL